MWTLISSILMGALAGSIATQIMKTGKGRFWSNVLLGIVGSLIGGFLASLIHLRGGFIVNLLVSVAGACLVLYLKKMFWKKGE